MSADKRPSALGDVESILTMLATTHRRFVQFHRGGWGFSIGAAYHPENVYPTLAEALEHEAEQLGAIAKGKHVQAARLTAEGEELQTYVDLIEGFLVDEKGTSRAGE